MKDKEKQIEEMANIPTKEEIEARNKIGKEKDELRQALLHYATAEASGGIKSLIDCEGCAFYLYEVLGYRKLPKDSVVLSKEEYEEYKQFQAFLDEYEFENVQDMEDTLNICQKLLYERLKQAHKKGSKETAEIFESELKAFIKVWKMAEDDAMSIPFYRALFSKIGELAKQFGVEIKEN